MSNGQEIEAGEDCVQCGHRFDPHVLVATTGDPMYGGLMFCPECECVATWGVESDRPPLPPPGVVAAIRAAVFGQD